MSLATTFHLHWILNNRFLPSHLLAFMFIFLLTQFILSHLPAIHIYCPLAGNHLSKSFWVKIILLSIYWRNFISQSLLFFVFFYLLIRFHLWHMHKLNLQIVVLYLNRKALHRISTNKWEKCFVTTEEFRKTPSYLIYVNYYNCEYWYVLGIEL